MENGIRLLNLEYLENKYIRNITITNRVPSILTVVTIRNGTPVLDTFCMTTHLSSLAHATRTAP
jgi:hypothetical protein